MNLDEAIGILGDIIYDADSKGEEEIRDMARAAADIIDRVKDDLEATADEIKEWCGANE